MYIIRYTKYLWVLSEDYKWTENLRHVKEYTTKEEATADAIKHRLTSYLVQST